LPALTSPMGAPRISDWGGLAEVMNGGPCFVAGQNISVGRARIMKGTGLTDLAQRAIVEGSQYIWEENSSRLGVAVLWRTVNDCDMIDGLSGAVLCSGSLKDHKVTAVCFQNFQAPVTRDQLSRDDRGEPLKQMTTLTVKGGFILPSEIVESEILLDGDEERRVVTFPLQYPAGESSSTQQRSCSGA
jgi:hypothetical protein